MSGEVLGYYSRRYIVEVGYDVEWHMPSAGPSIMGELQRGRWSV